MEKRIAYISSEIKRQEDLLADLEKKQDEEREKLQNLQPQMQKLAQAWMSFGGGNEEKILIDAQCLNLTSY